MNTLENLQNNGIYKHLEGTAKNLLFKRRQIIGSEIVKRETYRFGVRALDPVFKIGNRVIYRFRIKREPYWFGIGKREPYRFGVGKRNSRVEMQTTL